MSAVATISERAGPETVARLLASQATCHEAASVDETRRRSSSLRARALKWFGGAALVAGLAGLGAWTSASKSARAAPPPHNIEVPEIVVTSAAPPAASSTDAAPAPPPSGILADGRVVLNVASEEELTRLPSVGATRAKAIVALRTRLGKFRHLSELLRVKGIGRKTLAKIAAKAVLDAPPG